MKTFGPDESIGVTMAEALHVLSFAFIFLALVESVLAYKLATQGKEAAAARVDRLCFRAFAVGYVAIAVFIAAS